MWLKNEFKKHPDRMFICWSAAICGGLLSHIAGIICRFWIESVAVHQQVCIVVFCLSLIITYSIGVWFLLDDGDFDFEGFCVNLFGGTIGLGITVLSLPWFNIP